MDHHNPEFREQHDNMHEGQADRRRLPPPSPEMNVTPLIDVLLVLLVIFMAALPLTQVGVDINLPLDVETKVKPPPDTKQVMAEIGPDHKITLNKQVVTADALAERIRDLLAVRSDKTVFVMGDGSVKYGEVVVVIDAAVAAGARVAIVTEGMKQKAAAGG